MKAPGKTLLQVCGILFIIFGAINLLTAAGSALVISTWDSQPPEVIQTFLQQGITKSALTVSVILVIIQGLLYLATGILGVKNCNRPEKVQSSFILVIVVLVFILANAVYSVVLGSFAIVSTIINLIIPLLYLWGAMKNKQAVA